MPRKRGVAPYERDGVKAGASRCSTHPSLGSGGAAKKKFKNPHPDWVRE